MCRYLVLPLFAAALIGLWVAAPIRREAKPVRAALVVHTDTINAFANCPALLRLVHDYGLRRISAFRGSGDLGETYLNERQTVRLSIAYRPESAKLIVSGDIPASKIDTVGLRVCAGE